MQSEASGPSAVLLEAQARLLQLRVTLGIEVKATPQPLLPAVPKPELVNWLRLNAEAELRRRREQGGIGSISSWPTTTTSLSYQPVTPQPDAAPASGPGFSKTIVVQPTLVLALLKAQLEAPGRVYLLLRHIDHQGRGWLQVEDIRRQLTRKDSPLWICGWRRLRQLMHEGEGIFWHRNAQGQVWLMGLHKIAYTLDLGRAQGFPVELPIESLLSGIQAVRAAFYASFHSGRDAKPISRETLRQLSGIAERTQRDYDYLARVKRRRNMAIGDAYTPERAQERAWKQGRGVFRFVDVEGRQGRKNRAYIAWQLPSSYEAPYQRRSRGSRKRLNRKLKDLLTKGITGNTENVVEKVFFPNGALAARAYNRDPELDAYWEGKQATRQGVRLWQVISGMQM